MSSSTFPVGVEMHLAWFADVVDFWYPRRFFAGVVGTFMCFTRLSLRGRVEDGGPLLDAFELADGDMIGVSGTGTS